jgi:uncharacterized membrane protein (UPF0127 family)
MVARAGHSLTKLLVFIAIAAMLAVGVASLRGCDEQGAAKTVQVNLSGKLFVLEVAADDAVRTKGLGQREYIAPDGGMLFVFADKDYRVQNFLMRDCPVDIDIIYLDRSGHITAMHAMKKEPPRGPDEGPVGDYFNPKYHGRLPQYSSKFAAQFAIELAGGSLKTLKLKEGDKVELNYEALRKQAR